MMMVMVVMPTRHYDDPGNDPAIGVVMVVVRAGLGRAAGEGDRRGHEGQSQDADGTDHAIS